MKLLREIDKEGIFEDVNEDNLEHKLQIFVGLNLLKSISLRKLKNGWYLIVEKPMYCSNGSNLHRQFPCPTCSAIITAITRSLNQKLRVYRAIQSGDKIAFHLNVIKMKNN